MIVNAAQPFDQNCRLTDELTRQLIQNLLGASAACKKQPGEQKPARLRFAARWAAMTNPA